MIEPVIYNLDQNMLGVLRDQSVEPPTDPISGRPFAVGDRVVFCACYCPMLLDTWNAIGGRCAGPCASQETRRFARFDNTSGWLAPLRRFARPQRIVRGLAINWPDRIIRALLAEAALALIAYVGFTGWQILNDLPHTWRPEGLMFLLELPIAIFILFPIYVIYTIGGIVVALLLGIGAILIVINLFLPAGSYVDPLICIAAIGLKILRFAGVGNLLR